MPNQYICTCSRVIPSGECPECGTHTSSLTLPSIIQCAQFGLQEQLEEHLANSPASITTRDNVNATALHWAAINNRLDMVSTILSREGVDVDAVGGDLSTNAIYWATRQNHLVMVTQLLRAGANPHLTDVHGYDSVFIALQCAYIPTLVYLLGKTTTTSSNHYLSKMLHWIAGHSADPRPARVLLNFDPTLVHGVDKDGKSALHVAAEKNNIQIMKTLLQFQAPIDLHDRKGQSPLSLAQDKTATFGILSNLDELAKDRKNPLLRFIQNQGSAVLFSVPLLFLLTTALCLHYLTLLHACFYIGGATYCLYAIMVFTGISSSGMKAGMAMAPFSFGVNCWSVTWLNGISMMYFSPYMSWNEWTFQFALSAILVLSIYLTTTTNPGTLTKAKTPSPELLLTLETKGHDIQLCETCLVQCPPRSKHCREIGACVLQFDHFCPFVYTAVGRNNHHFFLGFLLSAILAVGVNLSWARVYFQQSVETSTGVWSSVQHAYTSSPVIFASQVLGCIHIFWISVLFGFQLYILARGYTTNEYLNLPGSGDAECSDAQCSDSACKTTPDSACKPTGARKFQFHSPDSKGVLGNVLTMFGWYSEDVSSPEQHYKSS